MGWGGTKVSFLAPVGFPYSPFMSSARRGVGVPADLVRPDLGWET
jgi:hypothetical protein